MPRIFAAIAELLLSTGAWAAAPAIVDSAFVAEAQKRGAIIWDVRSVTAYKEGHIPGAVNIGDVGTVLRDENTEDYLALPALERILGNGGIDPAKEIVVYGPKGNSFVYFALVTLQNFGARNARIYHGGIEDWKAAGMPVSTETTTLPPVTLKLQPKPGVMVSTPEVVQRLGKSDVQLVDARTPKEYTGDDIRAIRGGHIPGAVNIPYEENWQDPLAEWYPALKKQEWTPPGWVFGPVWTLLYPMVAVAGWLAWREGRARSGPLVYLLQLALNAAWPWLFFARRRPELALVCIVALWVAILVTIAAFWRLSRGAALLLVPYLAWVGLAAALNHAIWRLN